MVAEVGNTRRPDVLYITHRVPYPEDKGERIRCSRVLEYLHPRARIHLLSLADEPVHPQAETELRKRCHRVEILPLGKVRRYLRMAWSAACGRTISEGAFSASGLSRVLDRWTSETPFAAALASASSVGPYLRHRGLREATRVIDLIDVDSQKWLEYAGGSWTPRAWIYWLEGKRLRKLEARLAEETRGLTVVTDQEVRVFREFCQKGDIQSAPGGVDLEFFKPGVITNEREIDTHCVFVGALDYRPNVEGVRWFCRTIWPLVRQRCPEATCSLVGRRPVPEVSELERIAGIKVVGQVDDVRPYVAKAAVTIVPLLIARGIQNKVLESLAMGKATVVSPQTHASLHTIPGTHLEMPKSEEEWASTLADLFADGSRRERLGRAGRAYVEAHHRWDNCLEPIATMLNLPRGEPVAQVSR